MSKNNHYFEFGRGTYTQKKGEFAKHIAAGGLSYVGGLSLEQREELDKIISEYLDKIQPPKNSPWAKS